MSALNRRELLLAMALPLYPAGPLVSFSPAEAALVEDLCDCIIPEDDVPGARKAGVLYYIDWQLSGPLKRFAPSYHDGLAQVENWAKQAVGKGFGEQKSSERIRLLETLERERPDLTPFWHMLVDHTMQGFYGSPAHGGNREQASWQMLGIDNLLGGHSR